MSTWETSGDWVELFSPDDVDISGWKLRDSASTIVETVPQGVSIGPSSSKYYVISAENRLNRNEDTIRLLMTDDSTLVNEINYGGAGQVCAPGSGQTIGRYPDGNSTLERFATTTENSSNDSASLDPCPTPTPTPIPTPTPTPSPLPTSTPTLTPTTRPTPTLTKTPTPTKPPSSENNEGGGLSQGESTLGILGLRSELDKAIENTGEAKSKKPFPVLAALLVGFGAILVGVSGFIFIKAKRRYNGMDEKTS